MWVMEILSVGGAGQFPHKGKGGRGPFWGKIQVWSLGEVLGSTGKDYLYQALSHITLAHGHGGRYKENNLFQLVSPFWYLNAMKWLS